MYAEPSRSAAFWWKLTDNAFRRAGWYLLPVVLLTAVGVLQASRTLELYRSTGVLSAARNPLVPDQEISGATALVWESPAESTSRILNERLRTDTFIDDLANRAGLGEAVRSETLDRDVIRKSLQSSASGTSLIQVSATWGDPQTSHALALATITAYEEFLADAVARASSEAETFYTEQLATYEREVTLAETALTDYVKALPPVSDVDLRPADVQLRIEQLSSALRAAQEKVSSTQSNIEAAQLAVAQSRSVAGQSVAVIDAPNLPVSAESRLMSNAVTVLSFFLLGLVIAFGALLLTTVLDHTIASPRDLALIEGVSLVATVPRLRTLPGKKRGSRRESRSTGRRRAADLEKAAI